MILSVNGLLAISFTVLMTVIYKTSAKKIILFLDKKIQAIKHDFEDSKNLSKNSLQVIEEINQNYENLTKEIKYIHSYTEKELENIIETLAINIEFYDKEMQQKTNFTITQKKEVIFKQYRETTAKKIEILVQNYVSKQNSSLDIESLITTLSSQEFFLK